MNISDISWNLLSLLCKAKRQYLLTSKVSRYCLLALHGTALTWYDIVCFIIAKCIKSVKMLFQPSVFSIFTICNQIVKIPVCQLVLVAPGMFIGNVFDLEPGVPGSSPAAADIVYSEHTFKVTIFFSNTWDKSRLTPLTFKLSVILSCLLHIVNINTTHPPLTWKNIA